MSAKFVGSHPEALWIVGNFMGDGKTYLSFHAETDDPNITSVYVDMNAQTLDLFDQNGFKVWLQVEPANADMLTLIDLALNQYKHHPSVIGFGVDVEWYKSAGDPLGTPVTDEEAEAWVKAHSRAQPRLPFIPQALGNSIYASHISGWHRIHQRQPAVRILRSSRE